MKSILVKYLEIWAELESALYGKNGFGGCVAEIYAYRFVDHSPMHQTWGERDPRTIREQAKQASERLLDMLDIFQRVHPEAKITIDGVPAQEWANWSTEMFTHRCHVSISAG